MANQMLFYQHAKKIRDGGIILLHFPPGMQPHSWSTLSTHVKWFPKQKNAALANQRAVINLFNTNKSKGTKVLTIFTNQRLISYKQPNGKFMRFLYQRPWYYQILRLSPGSSVLSAELHGIHKSLNHHQRYRPHSKRYQNYYVLDPKPFRNGWHQKGRKNGSRWRRRSPSGKTLN